ncbi:MAG TPA: ankyrin repeat domain-containing protein [Stellaceae bacterium]|nr:ankyrin repeat domain-containing protein [Stellaceae bacterium]
MAILAMAVPAAAQVMPLPLGGGGFKFGDNSDALPSAAEQNKIDDVQTRLSAGDSPDTVDKNGRTALTYAAMLGNAAMAKLLIDRGASVKFRDKLGNTALHWAADRGNSELVSLLLAAHAPVDDENKQGITPLMMAAGRGQIAVVRLLLKGGADAGKRDFTGQDATGWAAGKPGVLQALREAHPS